MCIKYTIEISVLIYLEAKFNNYKVQIKQRLLDANQNNHSKYPKRWSDQVRHDTGLMLLTAVKGQIGLVSKSSKSTQLIHIINS